MWLDALAILLIAVFAWGGAWRGALVSGVDAVSLLLAYGAAVLAARGLAPSLAGLLSVPPVLAALLLGSMAFVAAYGLTGLVLRAFRPLASRRAGIPRTRGDRWLGGLFGALRGGLVVVMVAWLALWLDALRVSGGRGHLAGLAASRTAQLTGSLVERGMSAAMADSGASGRAAARIAARPGAAVEAARTLLEHPRAKDLQSDAEFWRLVESGSVDAALARPSFLRLARDDDFRQGLLAMGIVGERAASDPELFRAEVAALARELGPRIRQLREDPELARALADPELAALVESGNHGALMAHPGFRRAVAHIMTPPR